MSRFVDLRVPHAVLDEVRLEVDKLGRNGALAVALGVFVEGEKLLALEQLPQQRVGRVATVELSELGHARDEVARVILTLRGLLLQFRRGANQLVLTLGG